MNKIRFNKNSETDMIVESYGRNTYFNDGTITSTASCSVQVDDIAILNNLALQPLTAIQIYADDVLIYNLDNINARIDNINEYLNMNIMGTSMNITFQTLDN